MADIQTLSAPPYPSLSSGRQDVEYVVLAGANDTAETSLQEYWRRIWRHKWLLLLPMVCIMPCIGLILGTQTPLYTATATVLIEDTNAKVLAIPEVTTLEGSTNFYSTQYEIIKSRAVAEEVVEKLQLQTVRPARPDSPSMATLKAIREFPGRIWQDAIARVQAHFSEVHPSPAATELPTPMTADLRRQAVGHLRAALTVAPRKGIEKSDTKLVDIIVQGDDPSTLAQQANTVAAVYAQQNLEKRLNASRQATAWLRKEADTLRDKIAAGERQVQTLKADKRLVGSEANNTQMTDLQSLGTLHLSSLEKNRERIALRAELDELRKLLTSADLTQSVKYPTLLNNTAVSGLHTRYIDLQIQWTELSKKFMDKHPKMVALAGQIAEVRKAMTSEVQRVIASLENQYNAMVSQENQLKQLFNTQQSTVLRSDKDRTEYDTMRRDLDIHKAMYLEVSKRLAETTITAALETNNVTIVENALVGRPIASRPMKHLLLGLFFSLACGGGLALVVESRDKHFKNVTDAEQTLALPFLGFIPHHVLPKRRPPAVITLQQPWSAAAEAYHTVRTWIQLTTPRVQTLLVTSAAPHEGKSTTAANLAVSFAQIGRRVLLVDTDLRHSSLHRLFGGVKSQGLTDVLLHGLEWQSVVHEASMDNLKLLLAGSSPLNPTELLNMTRLKRLIESWKASFDLVIFDAPVVLSIPDVMILAPVMDGVLMVHSEGRSTRAMTVEARRLLGRANARVLGLVFNNMFPKEESYSSYYYGRQDNAVITSEHPSHDPVDHPVATPTFEMHPTIGPHPRMEAGEASPQVSDPMPVVVGRGDHNDGVHIILHTVTLRRYLGGQHAAAGMVFLIADVEITNTGTFGHVFDPTLTALIAREGTNYGRALASFIPIQGAEDDGAMLQTERLILQYDTALTEHLRGLATVVEIPADHTRRGNLVYHIPATRVLYTFVYTNPPIALSIPFTLPV